MAVRCLSSIIRSPSCPKLRLRSCRKRPCPRPSARLNPWDWAGRSRCCGTCAPLVSRKGLCSGTLRYPRYHAVQPIAQAEGTPTKILFEVRP